MAQSNHHRPGNPAGDEERPVRHHNGGAHQRHHDLSDFARHSNGPTSLLVPATAGVRVSSGRTRS